MTTTTADTPTLVIQPTHGWRALGFREIWNYRELLFIFAWRDLKVRYRQTVLGAAWAMGQPLIAMVLFTLVFNRIAKLRATAGIAYPIFVLSGVLIWNFISAAINHVGNSLIGSSFLISKVYFPRLVVPISNIAVDMADLFVAALLLIPLMVWYKVVPTPLMFAAPFIVIVAIVFALGIGLWVAALNVEYRDIRIVVPFALQLAMYATPVVYPLDQVPAKYRLLIVANPATGIVEGFRAALLGTPMPVGPLLWSIFFSLLIFFSGAFYFRRMERLFADVL